MLRSGIVGPSPSTPGKLPAAALLNDLLNIRGLPTSRVPPSAYNEDPLFRVYTGVDMF